MSGMFPKPTGADTFHAVGAFQQDNLVKGLINRWQTPDAFIGAIQAVNDHRPILCYNPSGNPLFEDFRCVIWCFPFCWAMLCIVCDQQLSKLPPLSHSKRFSVPREEDILVLHQFKNVQHSCFNCLVSCDVTQIQWTQSRDQQTSHPTLQVARPTRLRNRGNLACSNLGCYVLRFEGAWCMKPSSTAT